MIYALPSDEQTYDAVAGILERLPLADYDDGELHYLSERLKSLPRGSTRIFNRSRISSPSTRTGRSCTAPATKC